MAQYDGKIFGIGFYKTGTTSLLVLEYDGQTITPDHVGRVLSHGDTVRKVYEDIPL